MSSSDIAVSVRGLGKAYTIHNAPSHSTLGDALVSRLRRPFRRSSKETFWALKEVSFEIKKGEVVGVIGRNGAGKSTLLKILSRITPPTQGEVDLYGRVGSLLEVGTGFHQELTGRENIFLNGAILGMTRAEIRKQFDGIVDFAGVGQFLHTPVKRYSSGMYVRLAFAVAAHLRSEILIVDEVLAVGDTEFQRKCLGKMKEVSTDGRTVLFVSHDMNAIAQLCDAAILLVNGRLSEIGPTKRVVDAYQHSQAATPSALLASGPEEEARRHGTGEYRFTAARPLKAAFAPDDEKAFAIRIERRRAGLAAFFVGAHVLDTRGVMLLQCDSRCVADWVSEAGAYEGVLRIRTPWLKPGDYQLELYIGAGGYVDHVHHACSFSVTEVLPYPKAMRWDAVARGLLFADFDFEVCPEGEAPCRQQPAQPLACGGQAPAVSARETA